MNSTPRISIVTPSYNQGEYLEETITSVLNQNYPKLEHIIIDGGSTDGSLQIIEKYASYIHYYVSEKDNGQAHAINKGLKRITGDIWSYLCSDDTLAPGALQECVAQFTETGADVVYGDCNFITSDGRVSRCKKSRPFRMDRLIRSNFIWQPSTFLRRHVLSTFGYLDESFRFAMDYEYWLRIGAAARFHYVPKVLSNYRLHLGSKTIGSTLGMVAEARDVRKKYGAGFLADWSYLNFAIWGQYSYRFRRWLYDWLARNSTQK